MNTYKLTPLMMLLASLSMTGSYANYTLVYPLDNIKFTNTPVVPEEWSDGDPIVSEWVFGEKECSNWTPAENTKAIGVSYQQTANDCSIEKTRTVQNTEVSNLGNHRNVGELVTEKESDENLTDTKTAYGTRFTHTIQVAHYYGWGTTDYYGYFGPTYDQYNFIKYGPSSITPNTIAGGQIELFAQQDNYTILRNINGVGHNTLINYEMTVNGITCPLTYNDSSLPSTNTIMIAHCPFLKGLDGQTVKVDISPKQ